MKKSFLFFCLILTTLSCRQEDTYMLLFTSSPKLFGEANVFLNSERIGYASTKVDQQQMDLFVLKIKIKQRYRPIMTSNLQAVVINGSIILKAAPHIKASPLSPGQCITGYCSEMEYYLAMLKANGTEVLEKAVEFLQDTNKFFF